MLDGDPSSADCHGAALEVDVVPREPQGLTTTHPGSGEERERQAVVVVADPVQEGAEPFGGPGDHLRRSLTGLARGWRLGCIGDVAGHELPLECVPEHPVHDRRDRADGPWAEAAVLAIPSAGGRQLPVQSGQGGGVAGLEPELPDPRGHVQVEVPRVGGGRARTDVEGWDPNLGNELGEVIFLGSE